MSEWPIRASGLSGRVTHPGVGWQMGIPLGTELGILVTQLILAQKVYSVAYFVA
jgi:hypothetical protein